MRWAILPVMFLLAAAFHTAAAGVTLRRESGGVWILENEAVRVRFARGPNGYAETYWSLGDRWRLVLEAGSKKRADLTLKADGRATAIRLTIHQRGGNDRDTHLRAAAGERRGSPGDQDGHHGTG